MVPLTPASNAPHCWPSQLTMPSEPGANRSTPALPATTSFSPYTPRARHPAVAEPQRAPCGTVPAPQTLERRAVAAQQTPRVQVSAVDHEVLDLPPRDAGPDRNPLSRPSHATTPCEATSWEPTKLPPT